MDYFISIFQIDYHDILLARGVFTLRRDYPAASFPPSPPWSFRLWRIRPQGRILQAIKKRLFGAF
jgi:hypothetical protein